MRVMLMINGDPEPGAAPSEELLVAMGRYNDELKTAGVFPESKQLIAGYWILQVPSMTRPWNGPSGPRSRRFPRIYPGEYGATGEIEIRRVFELEVARGDP
jgi:hypothetical protein